MEQIDLTLVAERLRAAGALFAYLHGSAVRVGIDQAADVDVAAWFGRSVDAWTVDLPDGVDLLVLDDAPLELAGRVAQHGSLLFEDDPAARVLWQATTRKVFLDELPRRDRSRRDFAEARRRG